MSKFVKRAEQERSTLLFEESSLHLQPAQEERRCSDSTEQLNTSRAVFEMIGIEKEEDEENTRNVCTYLAECERSKGSLSNSVPSQQVSFALPELSLSDGDVSVLCSRIDSANREKSSLEILDCVSGVDVPVPGDKEVISSDSDGSSPSDRCDGDHVSPNPSIYNISSSSTESSPCVDRRGGVNGLSDGLNDGSGDGSNSGTNIGSNSGTNIGSNADSNADSDIDSPLEQAISGYLRSCSQQETRRCKRHTLLHTSPSSSPTSFHDIDTKQLFSPPAAAATRDRSPLSRDHLSPQSHILSSGDLSPSRSPPLSPLTSPLTSPPQSPAPSSPPSRKRPYPSRSTRRQHHNTLLLCLESQLAGSSAGKAIVSAARSECLIGPDIQCPVHGVVLVMRKVEEVVVKWEMNGRSSLLCGIACCW